MGRPRPLRSATDLYEHLYSLAGFHAPRALPDEAGPGVVQGPGFHSEEKVQGHREAVNSHQFTGRQRKCACVCVCVLSCVRKSRDKNAHDEHEHFVRL